MSFYNSDGDHADTTPTCELVIARVPGKPIQYCDAPAPEYDTRTDRYLCEVHYDGLVAA